MNGRLLRALCAVFVGLICLISLVVLLPHSTQAQGGVRLFLPLVVTGSATPEPEPEPEPEPDPDPVPGGEVRTGEGTFYAATGAGNCAFDATPDNLMVAAMNHTDYDTARMCGAFVEVTGPLDTIVVRIVDRCPECAPGDIDLSREAFALIANPADGRVPISWRIVSPNLEGPIVYHFKDGSNQWWTAVQIRNHRNPVAAFEYMDENGQFKALPRAMYNYFEEPSGMGLGPYTFRVTDIYGNTLTDSNIPLGNNVSVNGSQQFPPPSGQ
jgi:expansin (peptidoglycan-binding protein)